MILNRRCRPPLVAATLLTALALGGCGASPERTLTASTSPQQTAADNAKVGSKAKASSTSRTRSGKTEDHTKTQKFAGNSERECLVRAMYFESQRSSRDGLMAVGTVVINRVNSPSYPSTICGVVGQHKQFASGVLSRSMSPRDRHHAEAVADEIFAGKRHEGIGDAMFFHVASRRYKFPNMRYLQVAGGNIFYRKVGRNAPFVAGNSALAYANTAADPVTAIKTAMAPAATINTLTAPTGTSKPKEISEGAAASALTAPQSATSATRVSFTAPVDEALSRAQSFSTKPLMLSAYRTVKTPNSVR